MVVSKKLFFLILLAAVARVPTRAEEENETEESVPAAEENELVITLTNENFDEVVNDKDIILVEFYAPWCGHCKALEPEYEQAARVLRDHSPPVPLAKVDATVEEELGRKFQVEGFPTLKVFRKGTAYDYEGPRKADGIVKYMKEQASPDWTPPADRVIVLTQENFTETVQSSELALVEFYAPWCGHCKRLEPQYKKAAQHLYSAEPKIVLAKVDATEEKDLASKYGVTGYPTLKLFRQGRVFEYEGPRETQGIVGYMLKQFQPPSTLLSSLKEFNQLLKGNIGVVIGFFDNEEQQEFLLYADIANAGREEPLTFKHSFDQTLASGVKVPMGKIGVFIPNVYRSTVEPAVQIYDDPFKTIVSVNDVVQDLLQLSRPLVGLRLPGPSQKLYASSFPLLVGYVSFEDDEDSYGFWRNKLLPFAQRYSNITFVISDERSSQQELKDLKLDQKLEDIVIGLWESQTLKYPMYDDFEEDDLEEFLEDYLRGRLKPVVRSQPKPKKQKGPVIVVVGETFEKIVNDPKKDVLIEFYAPWCGHCKNLEPKYKELAKKFKGNKKLTIAKFDATQNDAPPDFKFTGFPTIFFVSAGKGSKPILYEGQREVEDMVTFLEEKATFSLGGSGTPPKEEL